MADKLLGTGDFNRRVEFFEKTYVKNASGESIKTDVSLGNRYVNRIDGVGSQDDDGQLLAVAVATFTMWYDPIIAIKASQLIINDGGIEWEIAGPFQMVDSKGRQMKLKCVARGES